MVSCKPDNLNNMKMELNSSALVLKSLQLIDDTKQIATKMKIYRASFMMMAYYLVELRPFLDELSKQQEFLAANSAWPSMQRFTNIIEGVNTFSTTCAGRSRIYLLRCHINVMHDIGQLFLQLADCIGPVLSESCGISSACQNMLLETQKRLSDPLYQEPGYAQLAKEIASMFVHETFDEHAAIDLLQRVGIQLNVHGAEVDELVDELKADLKTAELEGRKTDIEELGRLYNLFSLAEVLDDRRKLVVGDSPLHAMSMPEIPKPFFCPITKDVMREPVMLEQGHTYEKSAIVEWFQRGNRTCPDTGTELQSLELLPNVKLQQAMDEYFENRDKSQLMHVLQELRTPTDVLDLEPKVNTLKTLMDSSPKFRRLIVSLDGLRPLVNMLKPSTPQVKEKILRILYSIALLGDDYKQCIIEAEAVPALLRILQKNPGENGGPVQLLWEISKFEAGAKAILFEKGAILVIASAYNLCQHDQKLLAEKLLENLCFYEESVIIEAARSGVFMPLISSLTSGDEATKLKMSTAICASLDLNDHSGGALVRAGVVPPLLDLLQHGPHLGKEAAASALRQLSATDTNKVELAKAGSIPVLVQLLDTSLPQLKIDVMATLSNLASDRQSAAEINQGCAITHRLGMMLSGDPEMQEFSLRTLQCLARDSPSVRASLARLNVVPGIYNLLRKEGLSKNFRSSILNLLCYLAEDAPTREALVTSRDMVIFLISLVEGNTTTGEDKDAVLMLLAGLSRLDEMKQHLLSQTQLVFSCLELLRVKGDVKLQESATIIVSRLCDPAVIERSFQMSLSSQGLISGLMEVLSNNLSTERAKQHAAMALGMFSKCTPNLAERHFFFWRLLACLGVEKYKVCSVHGGKCSVRGTFCIVEGGAVPLLINLIKEGGSQSSEEAMDALSTLLEDEESLRKGVELLVKGGLISSLLSVVGKSNTSNEKVAKLLEVIFRVKRFRDERYSRAAKGSLATILATGTADARRAAATALMHLKAIPRDSVYTFSTSVS